MNSPLSPDQAALQALLHPPRLPADWTGIAWPEIASGLGLGLIAAWLLLAVIAPALRGGRLLTRAEARRAASASALRQREQHLAAARALPPPEAAAALAALAARAGIALPADLRAALYQPQQAHDAENANPSNSLAARIAALLPPPGDGASPALPPPGARP